MTVMESVDLDEPLADNRTGQLLLTRLHRDDEGNLESFVLAYAIKRVSSHGKCLDGVRTRHHSQKTKPFLGGWRGAMSHWASHNVDALKNSLAYHKHEFDRSSGLRLMSDCVLVPPGPPELSSLVLRTLKPSLHPQSHLLSVP